MPDSQVVEESSTVPTEETQKPEVVESVQGAETADPKKQPVNTEADPPADPEKQETPAWVQRRIDQLTREKHEERRKREALEAQLVQPGDTTSEKPLTQEQIETRADQIAQARLKQTKFDEACNTAYTKGKTEFKDFDDTLRTFGMLGGLTPEFLEVATDLPDGHKVLYALGKNPEEASRVLSLPPLKMAAELARMADKLGKTAPTPVSGAPAPITPVDGSSRVEKDPEKMSTEEWMRWRNETLSKSK